MTIPFGWKVVDRENHNDDFFLILMHSFQILQYFCYRSIIKTHKGNKVHYLSSFTQIIVPQDAFFNEFELKVDNQDWKMGWSKCCEEQANFAWNKKLGNIKNVKSDENLLQVEYCSLFE